MAQIQKMFVIFVYLNRIFILSHPMVVHKVLVEQYTTFLDTWVLTSFHLLQCWLKKQKDTLAPQWQNLGQTVSWTSGIIFGKGEVYKNIFGWCESFSNSEIRRFSSFLWCFVSLLLMILFRCLSFFNVEFAAFKFNGLVSLSLNLIYILPSCRALWA